MFEIRSSLLRLQMLRFEWFQKFQSLIDGVSTQNAMQTRCSSLLDATKVYGNNGLRFITRRKYLLAAWITRLSVISAYIWYVYVSETIFFFRLFYRRYNFTTGISRWRIKAVSSTAGNERQRYDHVCCINVQWNITVVYNRRPEIRIFNGSLGPKTRRSDASTPVIIVKIK